METCRKQRRRVRLGKSNSGKSSLWSKRPGPQSMKKLESHSWICGSLSPLDRQATGLYPVHDQDDDPDNHILHETFIWRTCFTSSSHL